jgi:hypothetical protein
MFRHRQQLRRWAARVLFLWLFGVATSVANACFTTVQAVPVAASAASHQVDGDDAAGHHGSLAKTNCQDFCGKASVTIPLLKSALDDVQSHALVATATTVTLPMPAFAPVQPWVPRMDGARSPPIPITFLRLAL